MRRGGRRCCWKLVQGGPRCCSVSIVHRMGCNKELSGPKRQVFCVCVFVFLGGVLGLRCYEGISVVVVSRGCSLVTGLRLLTAVASLEEHRLWVLGLQSLQILGSRAQAQWLWCVGLVVPWHVGSSWIRDKLKSLASAGGFFTTELRGKRCLYIYIYIFFFFGHTGQHVGS